LTGASFFPTLTVALIRSFLYAKSKAEDMLKAKQESNDWKRSEDLNKKCGR
jgi:hypothetical protein